MKKILLVVVSALTQLITVAQQKSSHNVYAFSREVLGGAKQKQHALEDGTVTTTEKPKQLQYFIYVTTKNNNKPVIQHSWLRGKKMTVFVNSKPLTSPVIFSNTTMPGSVPDTLIKKSADKIWLVEMKEQVKDTGNTAALKKLIESNELVLSLVQDKKTVYLTIKEIKKLQAVAVM